MDGYKALRLGTCILSIAIMVRFLAHFMYKRKINSAARWRYDNMGDIPLLTVFGRKSRSGAAKWKLRENASNIAMKENRENL